MTPGPNKQKGKGKEKERERTRLPKPTPDNMWGFDGGAFYSPPSGWASGAGSSHGSDWNASVPHLPYYRPDFGLSGHFQSPTDDSLGLPEAIKAIGNYEANYAGINAIKEDSADSTPWATASYPPVMVSYDSEDVVKELENYYGNPAAVSASYYNPYEPEYKRDLDPRLSRSDRGNERQKDYPLEAGIVHGFFVRSKFLVRFSD